MNKAIFLSLGSLLLVSGLALGQNPPVTVPANPSIVPTNLYGDGACCPTQTCCDDHSSWTGFYIGANGGWSWANWTSTINPVGTSAALDFAPQALSLNASGALAGLQAGYNFQRGQWVFGIEGDFDGVGSSDTKHTSTTSGLQPELSSDTFVSTVKVDALLSFRGRVGFAFQSSLIYLTGGIAWEELNRDTSVNAEVAPAVFGIDATTHASQYRTGYVLGAGYERMLTRHWIVRAEYLFNSFDHTDTDFAAFNRVTGIAGGGIRVTTGPNDVNVIRVGLSYKF